MLVFKKILFTFGLIINAYSYLIAQNNGNPPYSSSYQIYAATEQILGPDDLLINGKSYYPANLHATGTPEFEYNTASGSAIFIKGQRFQNIGLIYDIVSDWLVLVQSFGNGLENHIILHPAYIDSFSLGNHLFINLYGLQKGYYEKVAGGNISFLKKYNKKYLEIYDAYNRGKYSLQQFNCYLLKNGSLIQTNSRKSFLANFKSNKKTIRNYMHDQKIILRKADDLQIVNLMNLCNSLPDAAN